MRKWLAGLLGLVLLIPAVIFWEHWLPGVADFTLGMHRGITARQIGILLLKYTDPRMNQIGAYLTPEWTFAGDEHFLYFTKPEAADPPTVPEDPAIKAANLSALSGTYSQIKGTALINNTDYGVEELLNKTVSMPQFEEQGPAVLIYHTHTTEAYRDAGVENSRDPTQNVVAVGAAMAEEFRAAGYETIHLTQIFNDDFSQAYAHSRAAVEQVLKENPSIKVVLDVHRDAISGNGVDYYPVTKAEGKEAAQVMLVCGTDSKGLPHEGWRDNLVYALTLSRKMGNLYGQLSRPVNLRRDRFNTHFTPHTLLLEVGSAANTLDQALWGGRLTARSMIALWQENA